MERVLPLVFAALATACIQDGSQCPSPTTGAECGDPGQNVDPSTSHLAGVAPLGDRAMVTALHTRGEQRTLDARYMGVDGVLSPARELGPGDVIFGYARAGDETGGIIAWRDRDDMVLARLIDAQGDPHPVHTLDSGVHASLVAAVHGQTAFVAWITEDGQLILARLDRSTHTVIDSGSRVELGGSDARWWRLGFSSGSDAALLVAAAGDGWITGDSPVPLAATRVTSAGGVLDPDGIWLADRVRLWSLARGRAGGRFLVRIRTQAPNSSDFEEPQDVLIDAGGSVVAQVSWVRGELQAMAGDGERFFLGGRVGDEMVYGITDENVVALGALQRLTSTIPLEPIVAAGLAPGRGFAVAWSDGYSQVYSARIDQPDAEFEPQPF